MKTAHRKVWIGNFLF